MTGQAAGADAQQYRLQRGQHHPDFYPRPQPCAAVFQICAELEQLDLSVHDARIYNANDGMSLDTFFVLDSDGQPIAEDGAA